MPGLSTDRMAPSEETAFPRTNDALLHTRYFEASGMGKNNGADAEDVMKQKGSAIQRT